jgi:hypothetical protein
LSTSISSALAAAMHSGDCCARSAASASISCRCVVAHASPGRRASSSSALAGVGELAGCAQGGDARDEHARRIGGAPRRRDPLKRFVGGAPRCDGLPAREFEPGQFEPGLPPRRVERAGAVDRRLCLGEAPRLAAEPGFVAGDVVGAGVIGRDRAQCGDRGVGAAGEHLARSEDALRLRQRARVASLRQPFAGCQRRLDRLGAALLREPQPAALQERRRAAIPCCHGFGERRIGGRQVAVGAFGVRAANQHVVSPIREVQLVDRGERAARRRRIAVPHMLPCDGDRIERSRGRRHGPAVAVRGSRGAPKVGQRPPPRPAIARQFAEALRRVRAIEGVDHVGEFACRQREQAAVDRVDDDVQVDVDVHPVRQPQVRAELMPVLAHEAEHQRHAPAVALRMGAEALDVGHDRVELRVDAHALDRRRGDAVNRDRDVHRQRVERPFDARVPLRAVGDDVHARREPLLDQHVPHAEVLGGKERLAAHERRVLQALQERPQVVEERVAVDARQRRQSVPVRADRRRQDAVAHHACEVADVGHGEVHAPRPWVVQVRRLQGVVDPRVDVLVAAFDLPGAEPARIAELVLAQGRPHRRHALAGPDVAKPLPRDVAEPVVRALAARDDIAVRVEVHRHERRVAGRTEGLVRDVAPAFVGAQRFGIHGSGSLAGRPAASARARSRSISRSRWSRWAIVPMWSR